MPTLCEYIRIPNKSVHFDPQWEQHGHMERAAELHAAWCEKHALPGMKIEIVRLPGRTPLLFIDVPGTGAAASSNDCVLLYGHMDKQPEFTRLGGRARSMDAGASRRPAVRPRRRRRRLCRVRLAAGVARAGRSEHSVSRAA